MAKKRRIAKGRREDMPPAMWCRLTGARVPDGVSRWDRYMATGPGFRRYGGHPSAAEFWLSTGVAILDEWVRVRPGTRPPGWWEFQAPRWDHPDLSPAVREETATPRLILVDGIAREPEPWAQWYVPTIRMGLLDPEGEEDSPLPMVETERAYLARHGLLGPGEARGYNGAPEFEPWPEIPEGCLPPPMKPDPRHVLAESVDDTIHQRATR